MVWNKTELENTPHPKYLGVTLDRTLCYKQHIHNTKMKVVTHNNLLRKLSNPKWGVNVGTIRTTALASSYSVAEYAAPVWARSPHAQKLYMELHRACRAVTGCLKPTNVEDLYLLAGIALFSLFTHDQIDLTLLFSNDISIGRELLIVCRWQ